MPGTVQTEEAVIRFAGDSGDGMQLAGLRFSDAVAWSGQDLATLPEYPAEIRAPLGTTYGVSSFQVRFGSVEILSAGSSLDVLVVMNPAALKVHLPDLRPGGILIVNETAFEEKAVKKAGFSADPLTDGTIEGRWVLHKVPMGRLVVEAGADLDLAPAEKSKARNLFAVGLISWLFQIPTASTEGFVRKKFAKSPKVLDLNLRALAAGHAYGETAELFEHRFQLRPAEMPPGDYAAVTGNTALAWGLACAAQRSGRKLVYAAYPITPASEVLHEVNKLRSFGIRPVQAEDEIAAAGMALGASFAGELGVTVTSGPGLDLSSEMLGLAVMAELPLVLVDVQRAGPSTGLPTKNEASDLLAALYGRHGEAPLVVLAASSPVDCFWTAVEAVRLAVEFMTPVIVLSDGYLANCAEPWRIPGPEDLPSIEVRHASAIPGTPFKPYARDPKTGARSWAVPGTPGLEHRIGGLEKKDVEGTVNYEPANHEVMTLLREGKILGVRGRIPPCEVFGEASGDLLLLGWGGTFGSIRGVAKRLGEKGVKVSHLHLRHLHPLPSDLGAVLARFKKVLVPEVNRGQLLKVIRSFYLVDAQGFLYTRGRPLNEAELEAAACALAGGEA
ncbi:MAG: 2-oxoacid:acceptor oxidoreductase subunit alpha [Elusimicrobia bacterium]|nr:2-oxoacid:acceptor oxidoreductase subunit alpha [Elusimicrobiota bacterium]